MKTEDTIIFAGRWIEVWKRPDGTYYEKKTKHEDKRKRRRETAK